MFETRLQKLRNFLEPSAWLESNQLIRIAAASKSNKKDEAGAMNRDSFVNILICPIKATAKVEHGSY